MRDQNSSGLGGDTQHRSVLDAYHSASVCVAEVNRHFSSAKAENDSLVEVCVRLKSRRHPPRRWSARWRASVRRA
jgi:hypothetical protein